MLFIAFGLLLMSVLSVPVITAVPLSIFKGVSLGVFGFCRADGTCSSIEIGYDTGEPWKIRVSIVSCP
jgi:hypothetical protein